MDIQAQLERQRVIEESSVADGIHRFRHRLLQAEQTGRASQVGAARKLVSEAIEPMATGLSDMGKRRGPKHALQRWVGIIGTEPLAYITIKTVLDHASSHNTKLRDLAFELADKIVDEARYRRFKEQAPELFEYKMANFSTSNTKHIAKSLDQSMRWAEIDTADLEMDQRTRILIGVKLVDLLIHTTGLVRHRSETHGVGGKAKTDTYIEPTPETLEWLNERNSGLEALWPVFMPMVVPPMQWAKGRRGGYRFALHRKHPLVRGISKHQAAATSQADIPLVYEALNRIQETPWRINSRVLSVVEEIIKLGGNLAGIPATVNEEIPTKPCDIATNEDARKAWKSAAKAAHNRNHARRLAAMSFRKTISVAAATRDEAAIYFPCNLDFRGRVYPVSNYLNPQGDDLSKGLLTFADGKPLGEHGAKWLALHGANCLGETPDGVKLSKQTLQRRIDLVVGLTPLIERVASDPLSNREWCEAHVDEPLQFLAFCFEWAAFVRLHREGSGASYVCALPVAMDGTCNGLQHFSAMLRDTVGGSAVNVVPQDQPQDIYQRIADVVMARLEAAAATEELAALWLQSGLVNRKLAKRPTMTFSYGSKKYGFSEQIQDYVASLPTWRELRPLFTKPEEGKQVKDGNQLVPASNYMSALIWDALQETVVAASQGMKWMQDAARAIASGSKCVSWSVPATAFPVRQEYFVPQDERIYTVLCGSEYKPRVYSDTAKVNVPKQGNSIAPNVVHSMDAAGLMLTVIDAAKLGVTHFAMVHDSYGTLAADAEKLAHSARESFITLYEEHDVPAQLHAQWVAQAGEKKILPPPAMGTLDVTLVRESLYFFC